ncbi:MAG: LysM domain-containing protein, partial [Gammaproteobacteria bacterium]|nr:LysM domain-containing protein [Gammaproteobacteria bacterium]
MNRLHITALLIPACLCLWSAWLWAEPDPAQLAWLDQQGIVVHWDNVEGTPVQVDGTEPQYSRQHGLHMIELRPGDAVRLRLAAGEQLRILSPNGRIDDGDLELAWSNGSGLYLTTSLHPSADGAALLSGATPASTRIMRITRPARRKGAISVALFTSRRANPVKVVSYRDVIAIPELSAVRLADRNSTDNYWPLQGGQSVILPVPGATRLRLETRFMFPAAGDAAAQGYRITAVLDGKPWRVLEFETTLDDDNPVAIDGCFSPVGRRLNGYLEIPAGEHRLELRSTAPVYLRLLGQQVPDDYLWDGNRPLHQTALQHSGTVPGSIWDQTTAQVLRTISSTGLATPADQQSVLRLLQDNSWRDGSLIGSALTRSWALDYPEENAMRQLSGQAWSLHTTYRDLLPARQNVPTTQRFAWFRTPVLRDEHHHRVVPETYADTLSAVMAGGYFLEAPAGEAKHYEYRLPERAAPSRLRLSVDRSSVSAPTWIYLQFDDQPPRQLRVMSESDLSPQEWQPGRAEAALAVMNHTHAARGLTLAGPFAARNSAAPLLDVALIELPLPREVRRIRIWRDAENGAPVDVALQYRASRYYRRAGTAYQSLLQKLGPKTVYREFLAALSTGASRDDPGQPVDSRYTDRQSASLHDDARDLHNQWLPLLRLLYSRYNRLAATLQVPPASVQDSMQLTGPEIHALQQTAQRAEKSGNPVAELEAWTAIRHGTTGTAREQAVMAQVQVLDRIGEVYLAEQQLRNHLVGSTSDAFREQVLEQLLALYQRAGNVEARLNVLATAVIRDPKPATLRDLAETLLELGKTHYALQVVLALPPTERPPRLLLQASYTAGWWALFDEQLADIQDAHEYHWWLGWREQASGNYRQAMAAWDEAGATAAALQQHLAEGLDIRTQLGSSDRALRQQAVLDWERWQSRYPGSHRWNNEPQLVTRHAGAETVHITDQDQVFTTFRATPEVPITLQVQGPVMLRVSLRPLHTAAHGEAINDWVKVEDGALQTPFPVTDNRVAYGLHLIGNEQAFPGLTQSFEYRIAPGLHEIHITPERGPLLLQVAAARPMLPLTILPPLLPVTAQGALQGELGAAHEPLPGTPAHARIEVVQQCAVSQLLMSSGMNVAPAASTVNSKALPPGLSGAQSLAQATQNPDSGQAQTPYAWNYHIVRSDETLSDIALRYGQDYRQLARLNAIEPPYLIKTGQRLRLGKPAAVPGVAIADRAADAQVQEQMRNILWLAEHDATQTMAMAAAGEKLFQQHQQVPGLQGMLRRLRRVTSWELVPAVQASAGVRVVEVSSGNPENPAMRIRKALLTALQPGEQLLSGFETLVFAVDQPESSYFQIDLAMADLAPAQARPLQVRLQLDDGPEQTLLLTPDLPQQTVNRRLPGGSHLLRVRIADPVLNQYLRVVIREPGAVSDSSLTSRPGRRNYHVATRQEPVSVYLEGPTRVRIDELRDGQTFYRYRNLAAGWQRVRLEAGPQQEQALFRIYRLTSSQPSVPIPARLPVWTPHAVPLPAASLPA